MRLRKPTLFERGIVMKQYVEIKMVEQKTEKWIANDGTIFFTEKDCSEYERRSDHEKVKKEFEKLNPKFISIPLLCSFADNYTIVSVQMNNKSDFITVSDYLEGLYSWMDMSYISETFEYKVEKGEIKIPCRVVFYYDYDSESWCDCYGTEEQLKEELKKLLESF